MEQKGKSTWIWNVDAINWYVRILSNTTFCVAAILATDTSEGTKSVLQSQGCIKYAVNICQESWWANKLNKSQIFI
jgi:hypothetical protein